MASNSSSDEKAYQMSKLGCLMSVTKADMAPQINDQHAHFTQQVSDDIKLKYNGSGKNDQPLLAAIARSMVIDRTRVPANLIGLPDNGQAWVHAELACLLSAGHDQEQMALEKAREAEKSAAMTDADTTWSLATNIAPPDAAPGKPSTSETPGTPPQQANDADVDIKMEECFEKVKNISIVQSFRDLCGQWMCFEEHDLGLRVATDKQEHEHEHEQARDKTKNANRGKTIQSPLMNGDEVFTLLSPSKVKQEPKSAGEAAETTTFVASPEAAAFGFPSKPKASRGFTSAAPFGGANNAMPFGGFTDAVAFGGFNKAKSFGGHTKSVNKNDEVAEKVKQTAQKVKRDPNYPMRRHKREQRKSFADCLVKMREEVERERENARRRGFENRKQQADARKTTQESNKRKLELEHDTGPLGTVNGALGGGMPFFAGFSNKHRKTLPSENVVTFGQVTPLQLKKELSMGMTVQKEIDTQIDQEMNNATGFPGLQYGLQEAPIVIASDDDLEDGEILEDDELQADNPGRSLAASTLRGIGSGFVAGNRASVKKDPALQKYLRNRGQTAQQAEIQWSHKMNQMSFEHRQSTHPS